MSESLLSLGLMSGTSLDGVDAALLRTDGETIGAFGPALTVAYPEPLKKALRAVLGQTGPMPEVEREMTLFHADVVARLIAQAGDAARDLAVIGFHGHTVLHRPEAGLTRQIGDGALLARCTGIDVVNDFRTNDVKAGGQGAPLVPVFHAALTADLPRPLAVLNLGGVGNVTWIGDDGRLLAFDTGPGNALIDDWALRQTGQPLDRDGLLAKSGRVDREAVATFLTHPFFKMVPPKSLDRDDFCVLAAELCGQASAADGAATLTAFTVASVLAAVRYFPAEPQEWLVAGGGRRNPVIMDGLRRGLARSVRGIDDFGWDGDALEAQAFAYLAVRSLKGLPLTWPGTTGVARPLGGGRLNRPDGQRPSLR